MSQICRTSIGIVRRADEHARRRSERKCTKGKLSRKHLDLMCVWCRVSVHASVMYCDVLGFWCEHVAERAVWRHGEKSGQRRPGGKKLSRLYIRNHKRRKDLHVFRFVLHKFSSNSMSRSVLFLSADLSACVCFRPRTWRRHPAALLKHDLQQSGGSDLHPEQCEASPVPGRSEAQ